MHPTGSWTALKIATILTAALVAGEAIALLIGMRLLSEPGNSWISTKNDLILALDIAEGFALLWLCWRRPTALGSAAFWLITLTGLFSHLYRELEYSARTSNPFLRNLPLLVVNHLKLFGLLLMAILGWSVTSSLR